MTLRTYETKYLPKVKVIPRSDAESVMAWHDTKQELQFKMLLKWNRCRIKHGMMGCFLVLLFVAKKLFYGKTKNSSQLRKLQFQKYMT